MRAVSSINFFLVLSLVVLAPLPFASVSALSWSPIGLLVGGLLAVWVVMILIDDKSPPVGLRGTWLFVLLFGGAVVWAVLQALPVTPRPWHHPLWDLTADVLGGTVSSAISLNPNATRAALLRLLTYGGIFWLSLQYCRTRQRAHQVMAILAIAGLVYAAYGLVVQLTGAKMVLWHQKLAYPDDLTSTFINRNSYATYAGLGLLCAVAHLVSRISAVSTHRHSWRERLRIVLVSLISRAWLPLIGIVATATALLLTHSRGGLISTVLGMATMLLAYWAARGIHWRALVLFLVGAVVSGLGLIVLSGETTLQRLFATSVGREGRDEVYGLVLKSIGDNPWLGTGYGTFEDAFRFYRDESIRSVYDLAHNTYLENAVDLGVPAAVALVLVVAVLFFRCMAGARTRQRDIIYPCLGIGATILVATHSLVDFSLQIPAVAMTYALLMGLAVAQSWGSAETVE